MASSSVDDNMQQLDQQDVEANNMALHMNDFPLDARPTCPAVLIPYNQQLFSLPIAKMDVQVEFNVSTAFVRIEGTWENIAPYNSDCMFALPLHGTVTKVNIRFSNRELETMVIPRDLAGQPGGGDDEQPGARKDYLDEKDISVIPRGGNAGTEDASGAYQSYIPNLFRLPISNVKPNDVIHISVVYLEPLTFSGGQYNFIMPLKFGASLMPQDKALGDVLSIRAVINSVSPYTTWECKSYHEMVTVSKPNDAHIELVAQNVGMDALHGVPREQSENFHLSYAVSARDIIGTLIVDDTKTSYQDGTFVLFVTPPSFDETKLLEQKRQKPRTKFPFPVSNRRVIFLVDRSGSMTGDPYAEAMRALRTGMDTLNPDDSFTVICFDHEQLRFTKQLVPATSANIERAAAWAAAQIPKEGGTNIFTPLEWSLTMLSDLEKNAGGGEDTILPFVVLVTDGCVDNERDICRATLRMVGNTRVLTFGIGFYCNWYFLKMLAQIGRGFSDVVVYKDNIFPQMTQLMRMASFPVLTNIVLEIPGVESVELYPFPVPDLFMGAPLTLAGKYRGRFPKSLMLHARKPNGDAFQMKVQGRHSDVIPVSKVFLKQRIDILTARAWLRESKQLANEVTDLSCRESMPCPYTTMVAYERKANDNQGDDEKKVASKDRPWYRDRRKIAAITGGALVVVPAVAFSFGNVAASGANVPIFSDLDVFGGGCCDCCGDCDCGDLLGCLAC